MPQVNKGEVFQPLLTWGEHMDFLKGVLVDGRTQYRAVDMINYVRSGVTEELLQAVGA